MNSNKTLTISSKSGTTMPLRYNPQWHSATTLNVNGKIALIVPVETNLTRAVGVNSQVKLIVDVENKNFNLKTISLNLEKDIVPNPIDLYSLAFIEKDVVSKDLGNSELKIFNQRLQLEKIIATSGTNVSTIIFEGLKSQGNSALAKSNKDFRFAYIKPPSENCFEMDWYLQEWEYHEFGNLVFFDGNRDCL